MREAQQLGQLYVSALTGKCFFDWLSTEYSVDAAPLVGCHLLLAATDQEKAVDPSLATHHLEPTFSNCEAAITAWVNEVNGLEESIREQSRLIFFFSGHGLQSSIERQILLPCDYLGDDAVSFNFAISTENLVHGLDRIKVPYRYYFIDACRNDARAIREMRPVGREILPVYPSSYTYRAKKNDAVLFATTASLQAWQPTDPSVGPSLFGQALLDGLRGTPEIELTEADGRKAIEFFKLESYVNARIAELLRQHRSVQEQRVEPGGTPRPEVVTELPQFGLESAPTAETTSLAADLPDIVDFEEPNPATRRGAIGGSYATYSESNVLPEALQPAGWPTDFNLAHDLFGHETTTAIFSERIQVAALASRIWLPTASLHLLRVDRTEDRDVPERPGRMRYRMLVSIDHRDDIGHWLQLSDLTDAGSGVRLAQDHSMFDYGPPEYLLHVDLVDHRGPEFYGLEIVALEGAPHAVGAGPVRASNGDMATLSR